MRGLTLAICSATSRIAALPEPLSLMPGPRLDRVQVRADHHDVVRVTTARLGDHVVLRAGFCAGGDRTDGSRPGLGQLLAVGERGADDRDGR